MIAQNEKNVLKKRDWLNLEDDPQLKKELPDNGKI